MLLVRVVTSKNARANLPSNALYNNRFPSIENLKNMNISRYVLIAITLIVFPACEQSSPNQTNGVKDAIDSRPNEKLRDAAEDAGDAVKKTGHDIKDAVKGS